MLFNSIEFTVFLPIVFLIYWFGFKKSIKLQNLFILLSSYVFYGWWDWRFLILIIFSSLVDYSIGIALGKHKKQNIRYFLVWLSVAVNLGLLGFFKYYNFFLDNFISAFTFFGNSISIASLNIVLPVGISFYTFQTLSYSIDVYKRKITPTKDFVAFAAFVSFFPQLVAGPIERASNLLPQFINKRKFDYSQAVEGVRQILWGLFKKIVIADNCATAVDVIFTYSADYNGSTLLLGAFFFAFQIYGDFSGYSDIAIGTSKLFGFNLMRNFAYPYFSRDIAEFWRRWHISLSTWFRDYLYIPLGGSKGGLNNKIRNTFIIFLISGFWHGANWTFIVWGALNAIYFLPLLLRGKNRNNLNNAAEGKFFPSVKEFLSIGITFTLTLFAWIFFRADSVIHATNIISTILSNSFFEIPNFPGRGSAFVVLIIISIFMLIEWIGRNHHFPISYLGFKKPMRIAVYYSIALAILVFGNFEENQFIYFQF